ncbi:MLO-like protein 10 isoform X2 [Beta vulgaris subsp. vulgaris]|uniref:MLO-like protein 10 isoform X2 n=1 Tax=Beta vulgaris subsp. vulgaris TaxID=3555 RepID=UPI00053F625A|nr:MLO-like protein 10 isoform X2 [Beta vulgaris subsp. vulgaris]
MAENGHHGSSIGSESTSIEIERKLHQTPTWAVAGVCAVIILISFILEKGLQRIGTWLTKKQKRALYEALDKVKEELMVMGFISLLLTFSQGYMAKICIPSKFADHMLPCELKNRDSGEENRRKLLWDKRRILVTGESHHSCHEGHVPLITVEAAHQLHILIFFLAVFHVLYSAATMMLGKLKIRGWKDWERETSTLDYELTNNPLRFRLTHQTTFVRSHNSFWTRIPFFFYVGCFFRQFFRSVTKADYLTLRNGFITAHIAPGSQFDFQKYIKRSLEDDFKVVVGVRMAHSFLGINTSADSVGTKLQGIMTRMALEITERHAVVQGIPLVQGSDEYFWLSWPQFILHLLHFALFQNAFQLTYFLWILYEFGMKSCFHDKEIYVLIKIFIGIVAMILCSYSTLPLYALVTQMGSNMKKSVFDEQTSKALTKWHMEVKRKQEEKTEKSPSTRTLGGSSKNSRKSLRRHSSGPTLHRFMTTGHSSHLSSYVELHISDGEGDEIGKVDDNHGESEMTVLPTLKEIKQEDDQFVQHSPN